MAAPTQALPPWLSDSTSVATNDAGEPTATFTSVVNLPLTYFGPSIPLGSDSVWVFGGSSSPALSSSNPPTTLPTTSASVLSFTTIATSTSASALPPTSTSSSSPSSTLTTSPATKPTTHPPPPSSPSSSVTSSSAINGESSSHSHRAGVIVGSVLGSVVGSLMLLFALIWFMQKRRGNQSRRDRPRSEPPTSQVMWMWHDVRGGDDQDADLDAQLRSPDDASPQSSGDERDAFLRRSGDASHSTQAASPTARLVDVPRSSHEPPGPTGVALASGSKASSSRPGPRHIIPPKQLAEAISPEETEPGPDAPLLSPPAVNPEASHGSRRSLLPSERSMTPGNDPESALVYTAQRVQVGKSAQSSPGSTWAEGIGLPSVLRRSWLNPRRRSGTATTPSQKSSFVGRQLTDNELEAGRALNVQHRSDPGYRGAVRPISGVSMMSSGSARSGNTIFYDAQSREDLASAPSSPLPQGMASTGRTAGPSPLSAAPIRAASHASQSEESPMHQPNQPDGPKAHDDVADYLDAPIPRPASPFASVSSTNRMPPPPGLVGPDLDLVVVPSSDISDAINVELLEEEPPTARENWRQIAQGQSISHERRTTFGLAPSTIAYPREQTVSEEGSLYSMRSRLSPHSALSASGSAPASNSNSLHSRGVTGGSLKSLAHSSSVSSIDRRLARRSPGEVSPPLSATGRHGHRRSRSSNLPQSQSQSHPHSGIGEPSVHPQPLVPHATATSIATTGTGSSVTTHTSITDPITGEVGRLSHPPWTGGRDFDFLPEESEPSGDDVQLQPSAWGGGWSSPNHLRVLQNRVTGRESPSGRA